MVGGTAQPFHPIGDSNTDAFQSLCLHTFSGQHPDATGIARDSLSLTGPSLLSRATRPTRPFAKLLTNTSPAGKMLEFPSFCSRGSTAVAGVLASLKILIEILPRRTERAGGTLTVGEMASWLAHPRYVPHSRRADQSPSEESL